MKAQKTDHVAILVRELEKAGQFYADLFGTEFSGPNEVVNLDIRNLLSPLGIELVSPLTPDGVMARTLEHRGEGLTMLSLKVPNVAEAIAEMKARGIRQIGGFERPEVRAAIFHPKDLYGVTIELIQR